MDTTTFQVSGVFAVTTKDGGKYLVGARSVSDAESKLKNGFEITPGQITGVQPVESVEGTVEVPKL